MSAPLAAATPALWYLTRGTGAVALTLLTVTVVLGVLELERLTWAPRFMIAALHRSASLLVLVLLAVHVLTGVLDTFAPIALRDAVLPFTSAYRPLWVGLGTLAFDLLVALVATSLLRRHLGLGAWRAVHWLAYACWPLAVFHALGAGSDVRTRWLLILAVVCASAVLAAVMARLSRSGAGPVGVRAAAGVATVLLVATAVLWLPRGPLARGWARRAGTPERLLVAAARPVAAVATDPLARGFDERVRGTIVDGPGSDGTQVVDLRMRTSRAAIRVRLGGVAVEGGGLEMTRSAVFVGPSGDRARYRGRVTHLAGTRVRADVGASSGRALRLTLDLRLVGGVVTGRARARPIRAHGP